jgi:hypothetical protein
MSLLQFLCWSILREFEQGTGAFEWKLEQDDRMSVYPGVRLHTFFSFIAQRCGSSCGESEDLLICERTLCACVW